MVKRYVLLSNDQREELCRLIHDERLSIKEAALRTGVPYPNAKAVNKTFERESRTDKRHAKVQRLENRPRIINIPGEAFQRTEYFVKDPRNINLWNIYGGEAPL